MGPPAGAPYKRAQPSRAFKEEPDSFKDALRSPYALLPTARCGAKAMGPKREGGGMMTPKLLRSL